jgi:hypothetical protein
LDKKQSLNYNKDKGFKNNFNPICVLFSYMVGNSLTICVKLEAKKPLKIKLIAKLLLVINYET